MDKKTIIQINIEVPKIVNDLMNESEKYARGALELLKLGNRIVFKQTSEKHEPEKKLKKLNVK